MRLKVVSTVGAIAAGLMLVSAGAAVAMKLGPAEGVAVIPALDVDRAKLADRVAAKQAKLERQALTKFARTSDRPALLRYLKKHAGVDPARVVFQEGARNYAGPNCPGTSWNCTTARQVVQISPRASSGFAAASNGNTFKCSNSYPMAGTKVSILPDVSCVVVQIRSGSGSNYAECIQSHNAMIVTQHCSITQEAVTGSNRALVQQKVDRHDSGGEQDVFQSAVIDQLTDNGSNRADVIQDVELTMSGSTPQKQDAHQRLVLEMFTDDGNNTANVDQNEELDAHAKGATVNQLQNTEFDSVADCVTIEQPEAPNSCARILMDTDDGNNTLDVDQDNDLSMTVPGGGGDDDDDDDDGGGDDDDDDNGSNGLSITGTQQQGSCAPDGTCFQGAEPDGGTEAGIDMFGEDGTTSSNASGSATQNMPDNLPNVDQLQFADPFCCFGTIFENDEVDSDIELEVDQDAGVDAFQSGENGLACVAFGDGECSARLVIRNNDGTNVAEGSGQALFGHQKCEYLPPSEETFVILQDGVCSGPGVITVTTSTTESNG